MHFPLRTERDAPSEKEIDPGPRGFTHRFKWMSKLTIFLLHFALFIYRLNFYCFRSKSIFSLPSEETKSKMPDTPLRSSFRLPITKGDENDNVVLESSVESKNGSLPISNPPQVPALKPRRKPSVYSSSFDVQDRQVVQKKIVQDAHKLGGKYR